MPARIDIDHEQIAEFCKPNHIRKLSLFGSVLRDDFGPDSPDYSPQSDCVASW